MRWTAIVSAMTACVLLCAGASAQQLGPVGPLQKQGQLERKPPSGPPPPVVAAQATFPILAQRGQLEATNFHVWVKHANLIPPAGQEFTLDETSIVIVRSIDALPAGKYRAVFAVKRSNTARQLNVRSGDVVQTTCAIAVQASYAPGAPVQQCAGPIVTTTGSPLLIELYVYPAQNKPPLDLTIGDITLQRIQ